MKKFGGYVFKPLLWCKPSSVVIHMNGDPLEGYDVQKNGGRESHDCETRDPRLFQKLVVADLIVKETCKIKMAAAAIKIRKTSCRPFLLSVSWNVTAVEGCNGHLWELERRCPRMSRCCNGFFGPRDALWVTRGCKFGHSPDTNS